MAALKDGPNERDAGVVDEIVGYVTSTPPRSFFLFAGAGSGKTRTLVAVLRKVTGIGTGMRRENLRQLRMPRPSGSRAS